MEALHPKGWASKDAAGRIGERMDVIEIVRTIFRRWYVIVPVLLLTAGLAYTVASTAQAEYETTGSFLLTDASLIGAGARPVAGVSTSPQVLAEVVQGDAARARIREQGGTGDFEVTAEGVEGLLRVRASAQGEQVAISTAQLVMEELQRELAERQDEAGVPEHRRATVEVLTAPASARQQVVAEGTDGEAVRYVATGSLQVLSAVEQGSNPYAASLTGTIRVIEEVLRSPHVRTEIRATVGEGGYDVGMNQRDFAPIITVIARSTSPEGSTETFAAVADRMSQELQTRQEVAGVSPTNMLTLQPLMVPVGASLVGGELRRPMIVIVGLGLVAAVSLAVLVEGLATRSRRGRRERGLGSLETPRDALVQDGRVSESQVSQSVHGG